MTNQVCAWLVILIARVFLEIHWQHALVATHAATPKTAPLPEGSCHKVAEGRECYAWPIAARAVELNFRLDFSPFGRRPLVRSDVLLRACPKNDIVRELVISTERVISLFQVALEILRLRSGWHCSRACHTERSKAQWSISWYACGRFFRCFRDSSLCSEWQKAQSQKGVDNPVCFKFGI